MNDDLAPPPSSMRISAPPLSVGAKLGENYEIVGVLGEGGTGIVYEAKRIKEGDVVALKVIHPHLLGDAQIRGRFLREAQILRRLQGKYLAAVLDSGEAPDPRHEDSSLLYMALPKIEGKALDRVIFEDGPLPIEQATGIVTKICAALSTAHMQGVIHRDLKPANVIVRADGQITVVDFGMAKIIAGSTGTGTTNLTAHNMIFGTPEYMAPEQARGDELDARCDVYAVGVMLYELLAGTVPFKAPTPLGVLTAHLTSIPPPPSEKAPKRKISPALEAVVMHAIAKSPADRYATAAALATAIANAKVSPDATTSVEPQSVISLDGEHADGHSQTVPSPIPSTHPPSRPVKVSQSVRPVKSDEAIDPIAKAEFEEKRERGNRTAIWIVAALIGIGVGVWVSLHTGH
ncbi:MAG TPA: serine/threonine-protein kinase [Polyangiaceae bacterium]